MDTQFFMELDTPLGGSNDLEEKGDPIGDVSSESEGPSDVEDDAPGQKHVRKNSVDKLEMPAHKGDTMPPSRAKPDVTYQQLKMKYMRSLRFTDDELKAIRIRERRNTISSFPQASQSMPLAVPSPGLPIQPPKRAEGQDPATASMYSQSAVGQFVPPHELVTHDDTFSVWNFEQKKVVAKHAV